MPLKAMPQEKARSTYDRSTGKEQTLLRQLVRLYSVQPFYTDVSGKRREASPEALLLVLKALGAPVERLSDAAPALLERRLELWNRCIDPVSIAWKDHRTTLQVRLPQSAARTRFKLDLELEDGSSRILTFNAQDLPLVGTEEIDGTRYLAHEIVLTQPLPMGYHRLTLEREKETCRALIVAAPLKAYSAGAAGKIWGLFVPLYALHSEKSWGAGDFFVMDALYDWLAERGGSVVGTLPFLAAFLDEPFEPSPYSPASRLFWNEFFLDMSRVPDLERCPKAQERIDSLEQSEVATLRAAPLVDYRRQMALKRSVLEVLSESFFSEETQRHAAFREFTASHPAVEDYARFRAAGERFRLPWQQWPQPHRDGVLTSSDYDDRARRYHLYVQWLAHEQIQALSKKARETGPGLYLDLPIGIHPSAYDIWRERSLFPRDIAGGAPPDIIFSKGQNWGFPPLHPEKMRETGYHYVIDFLSHMMRQAGILRIDHVMGLHRIYWIPSGMEATQGVFVHYPADEFYAILSLESHRNKCWIVGENLGTVPDYVNEALSRHRIQKMYVVQYELESHHPKVLRTVTTHATASLNTHDMPPFSGFWHGEDIEDRHAIGLVKDETIPEETENREKVKESLTEVLETKGLLEGDSPAERSVFEAALAFLGSSPAKVVLANLEDLWLERHPQNLPGTSGERPNWRQKTRYTLETLRDLPEVVALLQKVDRLRKGRHQKKRD